MSVHVLALSYNKMTNLSMIGITSSEMSHGVLDNYSKTSVSSGSTFQVFHAVFLPNKAGHSVITSKCMKYWKCP